MAMDDQPRALAADVFNEIITDIKESRPTRTDGESTTGYVYCMLRPGIMVSPRDHARPWSPIGGTTSATTPPPDATTPVQPAGEAMKRAMEATFKTFRLFDKLLMVTDDGTTQWYGGGGRQLSFQYAGLLQAMEATPVGDRPPEVQARVDAARKVLYDEEFVESALYQRYKANQTAYAKAKGDFIREQIRILGNPAEADHAPILLAEAQARVDQAYRTWKAQGAAEVEEALATLNSLGVLMEQGMIDRARQIFEGWSVPLLGVAGTDALKMPYTFVLPSEWAEITTDDIGWTTVTREAGTYSSYFERNGYHLSTGNWSGSASSASGSAGLSVFGFGFGGSYAEQESQANAAYSTTASDGTQLANDARDLSISLQYGIAQIVRPWLVTDLFQMQNWYLRGERKGAISDGTITNQVGDTARKLPMLPTHVLLVRNVRIRTSHWGSVKDTLTSYWSRNSSSSSSSGRSFGGSVSIPIWGPLALTGGYRRSDSNYQGDFTDEAGNHHRDDYGSWFENDELVVNGTQIVAFLGEIMPACPPLDDPSLPPAEE